MKKIQLSSTVLIAAALALAGLGITTPVAAATITVSCTTSQSIQVPAGDTVEITGCSRVSWSPSPLTGTSITVSAGSTAIAANNESVYSGALTVSGIANMQIATLDLGNGAVGSSPLTIQVSLIGTSGGASNSSSSDAVSEPVEVSLSLDLAASGASCTSGSAATGVVGTWLSLPGADDCTSTTTPSAKLLGWATRADFPVAIAQRQVDNGWGAYELFNDEGRMTAVFIPAGGATFVSASTSLHPIWAS